MTGETSTPPDGRATSGRIGRRKPRPPPSPWRWLWRGLIALAVLAAVVLVPLNWVLRTEDGTAWLLSNVPQVRVNGMHGRLFGDFSADRLEVTLPGGDGTDKLVLSGVHWRGLALDHSLVSIFSPASISRLAVRLAELHADRVDLQMTPDPNAKPASLPSTLKLPIEIEVKSLQVGEVHASALGDQPLRRLQAHLHLGDDAGATHRIDALSLAYDRLQAAGSVQIGSSAPFEVRTQINLSPDPDAPPREGVAPLMPFAAKLNATGPLAKLGVEASLRGAAPAGRAASEAPAVDVRTTVLPFESWPLGALQATTQALDLSALASGAPATALSGSARLGTAGLNAPAVLTLSLDNARAGRVDEGLLPLRSLRAEGTGKPDNATQFELRSFEAELGTATESAGRVQGSGHWMPLGADLELKLADLRPRALDRRAPEMRLAGLATVHGSDLVPQPKSPAKPHFELRGNVAGTLEWSGRTQKVQIEVDGAGDAQRIDVRKAVAQAGASKATLVGVAQRSTGSAEPGWQVAAKGSLSEFDPAAWWPGEPRSAWRQGPHRLNAALDAKLAVPDNLAARKTMAALVAALRGDASVTLTDSLLAGAPIAGQLSLHNTDGTLTNAKAALDVAGAHIDAEGRLDARAGGARDHWQIDARGADLARFAPLMRLAQPVDAPTLNWLGQIDATAVLDGRWPSISTQGTASLRQLHVAPVQLDTAALRWQVGTAADAPLDVQADVSRLVVASGTGAATTMQTLDSGHVALKGSFADHTLSVSAASPVMPPAWVDLLREPLAKAVASAASSASSATPPVVSASAAATSASVAASTAKSFKATPASKLAGGTLAELRARGGLQFDTAWKRPLQWHGTLQRLDLSQRGGASPGPWLAFGTTPLDVQFDPLKQTPRVDAGAGRVQLPGAGLRWSQIHWQGGAAPLIDVQAELEPIAAAPLLARVQPDFGWGGDLVVAGKINLRSAPTFVANIEIARQQGDLHVSEGGDAGPLQLGLTDLRVALDAKDGNWAATLAFAGKTLGAMAGAITVHTDPKALWPGAEAPVQGVLESTVANLGAWGAWVPTGWRLAGRLHASASISGRFGAPEYTGEIDGGGLGVRNLLEGIDLHDGELGLTLKGETAHIDKFTAKAGEGTVGITGDAGFGASPQAQLKLVADRVLVLGRVDRHVVASGQAALDLDKDNLKLDGQFKLDEGLIDFSHADAPSLGDDVEVVRDKSAVAPEAASNAKARTVAMNVALDLGDQLHLKGRGLDTRLRGKLQISAPSGRLAIDGNVRTFEGTYAAYRQKLDIERGLIAFSGPVDNPRLDILAIRPNLDTVRVGVAIGGTALNPRVRLYSEPDMADSAKLAWLVLGRAPDEVGGSDAALLQSAALALLAGEGGGPTDDLTKRIGLDDISLRQGDTTSSGQVRDTVLALGKQLSKRWYLGYERGLNATAGSWQLIYRAAQHVTVRAQSGFDNSLDVIWTWRWGAASPAPRRAPNADADTSAPRPP